MQLFPLKLRILCGCFLAGVIPASAQDSVYINSGAVTNPVINAVNVVNEGYFQTSTSLPYETSNTLNYTNMGTMMGSIGYRFHTFTSNGVRKPGLSFHNEGVLEAVDNSIFFSINGGTVFFGNSFNSFIMVNTTNIVNAGSMTVGASGLLRLDGKNIDLRGGALQAADSDFSDIGFFFTSLDYNFATNFFNETKVSDYYWGVGTNNVFGGNGTRLDLQSSRFDPSSTSFGSGYHQVRNANDSTNTVTVPSYFGGFQSYGFRPFTFVDQVTPSNKVVQVVFVSTNSFDPDMSVDVRFAANGNDMEGSHAVVQFSVNDTDSITGLPVTRSVYFGDNSSYTTYDTNTMFYQENIGSTTYRPNPYDITFYTPVEWTSGAVQNTAFSTSLLYNPSYVNRFVTNAYAGYSAYIGNALDTNVIVADAFILDPTNSLGRIEIFGGSVDLNLARMRSEGLLTIKSDNFQQVTTGAKLDAQQLNLNLTSTNQTFLISNILAGTVKRIAGRLNAYSCTWSNQTDTGDADRFHVLILENLLKSAQPSTAYGFIARVTNQPNSSIVLEDDATVARDFYLDAENITIGGSLVLPDSIGYTNMPRVVNFTNNGVISVPSLTSFRLQSSPYVSFVNTNAVVAGAQAINATYFANSGLLQATVGSLSITNTSGMANLTNGFLMAATDIRLTTGTLKMSNTWASAGSVTTNISGTPTFTIGSITFNVENGFVDGGSNTWSAYNGVNLHKGAGGDWVGDLLGTKVISHSRPFSLTRHTWTAVDRGADRSGYTNNAALGVLTLNAYNSARFRFSAPTATPSAIYVDYLELNNNATNYTTALDIDSNMKIYFASANVPPSKLDGAHGGRLRWVQNYAGPNSSTNIVLQDGRTITVNRALVESSEIDSDGDGTPNQFDTSPFDAPSVTTQVVNVPPMTTFLTWNGAANTTYTVDYTTNLVTWQVLTSVTTGSSAGPVSASDPVSPDGPRFYRVRYSP